ncbi:MAG: hypothetical protein GPJ52_06545, partial [Candidatus Heimdallarchaeota archaeon]|nr:hypothetical protein [Candidatus Heimdallarchaeota archaeon]
MEKDELEFYPSDPIVAKFLELYDQSEVWDTSDSRLPMFYEIYEKIDAKAPENEIRKLIESNIKKIFFSEERVSNFDAAIDIITILLLGELKATDCVEKIVEIYANALRSGSEYIQQYHYNWEHDEFADIRSACIKALSKIDDPRGYATIYHGSREVHHYVAQDAWEELTYERFKHAVKDYSVYNLKRLKHPLDWQLELGYDEFVDKILADRGFGIQNEEHRISEKLVFKDDSLEDYQTEAAYANSYSEEMKDLELRELLLCLIKEYQTYSHEEYPDIRCSTFVAFFFKQIGFETVKEELEKLIIEFSDSEEASIVDELLSLIDNPEQDSILDDMSKKIADDIKDSEELEKQKAARARKEDPMNCPVCGNKLKSPECQCNHRTGSGYLIPDEKSTYMQFY